MNVNDNVRCWSECWKATTSAVKKEPDEKKLAESWDKRWEKRPERHEHVSDEERMHRSTQETLDFLDESGFQVKGKKVLDIGCGPGVLSIPLARLGAEVTSFDISPKTLDRIQETATEEHLPVKTIAGSWWTADIDELRLRKNFDLVIASRTPAINDAESIERMMSCSKDFCYYSSFLNLGENRVQADLRRLVAKDTGGNDGMRRHFQAYTMVFPFMYLYFSGYRPLVRINSPEQREELNRGKAAERAIRMFGHGSDLDDKTKEMVRNYFNTAPEEDLVHPNPAGCHGMMIWNVQGNL